MHFETNGILSTTLALTLLAVSLNVKAAEPKPAPSVTAAESVNDQAALQPGTSFRDCQTCPEMMVVSPGSFQMGDAYNKHTVTFAQPFSIGKYEVTQAQWKVIMGFNPSQFAGCDDCPVENVSWDDAQHFIRRLNTRTGKQYRLPSEAEWEASCRGGEKHQYCGSDDIHEIAWYGENSDGKSHPVGGKKANAFGLHDMSGNVWEWVEDGWHKTYDGAPVDGSAWPGVDSSHVLRGGSWYYDPWIIDAADRNWNVPSFRYGTLGFRVARSLP